MRRIGDFISKHVWFWVGVLIGIPVGVVSFILFIILVVSAF